MNVAYYQQRVSKIAMLKQIVPSAAEMNQETFPNKCFKTIYERSNKQFLATVVELLAHSSLSAESQQKTNG